MTRSSMKKHPSERRARPSAHTATANDQGRTARLADVADAAGQRKPLPPPSADRPLYRRLCMSRSAADHRNRWRPARRRLQQDEAERSRFLEGQGYRMLRFWNNEVSGKSGGNPHDDHCRARRRVTARGHPHPTPPPSRGRARGDHPPPSRGRERGATTFPTDGEGMKVRAEGSPPPSPVEGEGMAGERAMRSQGSVTPSPSMGEGGWG